MSRKVAREYTFQLVFEYLFHKDKSSVSKDLFFEDPTLSEDDKNYVEKVYDGVVHHYYEIIDIIKKYAIGYTLDRIYRIDLAVLVLAIYEMKYVDSIPIIVSINEAINIVNKYSTQKSHQFVNGILASVRKELENV